MADQVGSNSFENTARQMRGFAQYVDGMHQRQIAQIYEEAARKLEDGVTHEHLYKICKAMLDSFIAHADGLLVSYVQKPDGSPDAEETEKYYSLLNDLRAFAHRNLWKARLSWIFRGFRW